ncbi:MAG: LysR family transcriptional regulator [Erysipelotrichaceae bacterium]
MRKLRIFKEVADQGNLSKAAQKLHIAQPAVSLAIKELEAEYGCVLFERLSRRLYITEKGKTLLHDVNRIIEDYDLMEAHLRQSTPASVLRIGVGVASSHGRFIETMQWIKQIHPDWDVRVSIHITPVIQRMLIDHEIDVGIIEGPASSSQLISKSLYTEDIVLLGCKDSPLNRLRVDELPSLPMILRETESMSRIILDEMLAQHGIRLNVCWSSSSIEIILRAVQAGLGYTLLPVGIARPYINRGDLKIIALEGIQLRRSVSQVLHRDKAMTPPIEAFLKKMEEIPRDDA